MDNQLDISKWVNKIHLGDCLDVLKQMPDKSVNCVISSPPYWQLRDYGWTGQWGLEKTFQEYLEHLWQLMDEICRVLKDDGTVWINLGDTYSTQNGTNAALARGKKYDYDSTYLTNRGESELLLKDKSLPNKSLCLIPHRFAIGCSDRGWIVRNDIIWSKRNGMPESVTDRFSKKHEYFFFMTKQEKYYFDLESIRDKHIWALKDKRSRIKGGVLSGGKTASNMYATNKVSYNENGKNPGSVSDFWDIPKPSFEEYMKECEDYYYSEDDFWDVPTRPSSDEHYAAYNTKLISKPILSGCPKGGIILDPFCGTATTACCALDIGRQFIGIEGKEKYVDIGNKKLFTFLHQARIDFDELI